MTHPPRIDYATLVSFGKTHAYTDHILHFKALFELIRPKCFFELGCGYSTSIFMDNSDEVVSVELAMGKADLLWFHECERLYKARTNWTPVAWFMNGVLARACAHQASKHTDYALVNDAYVKELSEYLDGWLAKKPIEVAFVDPGVYIRGDLVELLLQKGVPVVAAHDTANSYPDYPSLVEREVSEGQYGWFKIKQHPEYEKIFISYGGGTTFWVRKDFPKVVAGMQKYSKNWPEALAVYETDAKK